MKIAFDVDGVVLRSIDVIIDHINQTRGSNITPDDLEMWDLDPLGIDVETLRAAVRHMYVQPRIEHYRGAVRVLSRIFGCIREPLLFITGRPDPGTAHQQLQALPWKANVPEMIVTGGSRDKKRFIEETGADFIIEDDPCHLAEYLDQGIGVGLMLQPWNRKTTIPVTARFEGWQDLEQWFLQQGCDESSTTT
jgi:hypothetical protein